MKISEKVEKIRVSVTMTKPYAEALDHLVAEGLYFTRGEAVLEALRIFLRERGIKPFANKVAEPEA